MIKYCPVCKSELERAMVDGKERLRCPAASCGYVHWDSPTPVVAAIVELDGCVVLTRSKGWPEKMFGLVAGFLEQEETPEAGVLREVQEELGLTGEIAGFVGHYVFAQRNQLVLAYHVRAEGEVVLGEELAEVKRVPPEKLRPWPIGTGPAVRDWLARRGGEENDN